MSTAPEEQSECCAHDSRYLCGCLQGFKSHAMGPDEDECQCGKIKLAEAVWSNCSGMTHVFQPDAERCVCLKRFAGVAHAAE